MPQPNEFMLKKEEAEDKYQKKLTAGTNITIDPVTNEISAAGGGSTVTYAGTYSYGDSLGALTINGNVSQIKTPNLVPGNNVNITRDAQTGAITISSTGGDDANVEPNPDGEPTDTLSTLGVDGEIIDYYLQEGLIGSSGGSYITCNLDKNLVEDEYIAVITDADETQYVKTFEYDGTNNVTIQWIDSGKSFTLVITSTTAGLTNYSGAWRNIYCDIYTKSYGQIIYEVGGDKRGLEYFKETPTSLYGESILSVMTDPRFVFDDQVSATFRAQGGTHTWSVQAGVTTGIAQTHVIRSFSANTWQGIFQMSDDPSDLGIYYKFVKDNWWDVDSEGTMTYENAPNAMIYPCTSNVNAYGYKDTFEVDEKTYYIIAIGSNQIDFTTSRVGTYAASTLYLPSYDGTQTAEHGYYRTLGEFGNYLLTTSQSFYYNGLSMDKKLAFFAGGEDENGTNAPIKIYIDGTTEGLLTEYDFDNSDMTGATSSTNGEHGLVPQPLIADKDKILKGNGTWGTINLEDLANVNLSNLSDEQILKYNLLTQKWENADESGGSSDKVTEVYDVIASGDDCYIVVDQHIWLDDGGGSVTRSTAAYEDITSVNGFIARLTQTAMDDGGSSYNTDVTFSFDDVNKTVTMSWTTLSGNSGCYVDIVYTKVNPTIIANDLVVTGTNSVTYNIAEIVQGYQNLVSSNFMFNLKHIYSDSRGLGTSSPFNINFNQTTGILTVSWNNIGSYNELTGDVLLLYRPNGYRKILDMVGATDELNGYHGYTPAPLIGDENKFLKGNGTWAYPPSGTEVIANPTGSPTDTLNTISIDGTIYEIEGGGSGGEGSFESTTLYTGTQRETTINLSDDYTNYDYLILQGYATVSPGFLNSNLISVNDMTIGNNIGISDNAAFIWYTITDTDEFTFSGADGTYYIKAIYGLKESEGGSGNFYKKTTAEYQALPLSDKEDPDKLYFIDDSGAVTEDIDSTDWTNNYEHGNMSVSVVSDKLTYDWDGGTDIGALSVITTAIPSTVDKIKFKVTTGTSYNTTHTPSVDRFKIYIGLRDTNSTTFFDPTQVTWLASTNYNTANSVWENELDLLNVTDSGYLYFYAPGWDLTLDYMQLETASGSTDNCIYYQNIKYADNDSGGNVDDVYVNGESVLDTNKIAQVKTHKEVSLAEYEDTNDNIIYFVDDDDDELGIYYSPVIYSTEEREVGTWTNGKPLYEKTIYIGSMTKNSSWNPIAHNINNIEKIIKLCGQTKQSSDGRMYNIPHYRPYDDTGISIGADTTYVYYMNTWLEYASDTYVTIQYTKTTDTSGSAKYNALGVPMVHYSTNEQVIGTWIDGKPLYEKTFTGLSQATNGADWVTVQGVNIPSVKDLINATAWASGGSGEQIKITLAESTAVNDGVRVSVMSSSWNRTINKMTIQYTKTTD